MAYAGFESARERRQVRNASGINVLIGGWLLVAPFLLQSVDASHWNDLLAGVAVLLLAGVRFITPRSETRWLSWINALIGTWLVFAPFALDYATERATWNDIVAGVLLVCLGIWSGSRPRSSVNRVR